MSTARADEDIGPDGLPAWHERVEIGVKLLRAMLDWEREEAGERQCTALQNNCRESGSG